MDLLIYFAIPVAVIILSAVLETVLHSPVAVASVIFSILLIVTFAAFDATFLVLTIIYTIISYITALLTKFIYYILEEMNPRGCNKSNFIINSDRNSKTRNMEGNIERNIPSNSAINETDGVENDLNHLNSSLTNRLNTENLTTNGPSFGNNTSATVCNCVRRRR